MDHAPAPLTLHLRAGLWTTCMVPWTLRGRLGVSHQDGTGTCVWVPGRQAAFHCKRAQHPISCPCEGFSSLFLCMYGCGCAFFASDLGTHSAMHCTASCMLAIQCGICTKSPSCKLQDAALTPSTTTRTAMLQMVTGVELKSTAPRGHCRGAAYLSAADVTGG